MTPGKTVIHVKKAKLLNDWKKVNNEVKRLRERIFQAKRESNFRKINSNK